MTEFRLQHLGDNIKEAEVLNILIKVGNKIGKDEPVIEISSDKATIEIPSDISGIVKEIYIKEGDKVKEGSLIFTFESEEISSKIEEQPKQILEESKQIQEKKEEPNIQKVEKIDSYEFRLQHLGDNIKEAEVLNILVKVGNKIEKNEPVIEISSDKATIEIPSDISGIVKEINIKAGDKVKEGSLIFTFESEENKKIIETPKIKSKEIKAETEIKQEEIIKSSEIEIFKIKKIVPASPSIRRFAREIGVDITKIIGTGENGRISIEDIKSYSRKLNEERETQVLEITQTVIKDGYYEELPDFSKWGEIQIEKMNNIRYKTAKHLGYSWSVVPQVTQFDKADITELEEFRKRYNQKYSSKGIKITFTAILMKFIAIALKKYPKLNSSINLEKREIINKNYYHIGMAVDTPRGLVVPVIRDVDKKNIIQISLEVNEIAEKARNNKLSLEEMQGATFTISNQGGIGGTNFTPLVNHPEVAILGVSQSSFEPVYNNGQFEPKLIMPLSVSYDHRIIDGADATRFLRWIVDSIKEPALIIFEG